MIVALPRRSALLGLCACGATLFNAGQTQAGPPPGSRLLRRADRLFVAASVNGHPVEALLDSGAETSVLDRMFAAELGRSGGESQEAHGSGAEPLQARLAPHVRLEAAGVRLNDATLAVIDLSDVSRRLVGRPLRMILGREIFDAATLVIDIPSGTIRRLPAGDRALGQSLILTDRLGLKLLPVRVEGRPPVLAEFDLGNGSDVLMARRYAQSAGLLDGRQVTVAEGGGLGGAKPRGHIILKTLTIAGRTFADVPADLDDSERAADLNVGVRILQHFGITTDFRTNRIWLRDLKD